MQGNWLRAMGAEARLEMVGSQWAKALQNLGRREGFLELLVARVHLKQLMKQEA